MADDLLYHYDRELAFLKEKAGDFARQHPAVAEGLRLDANSVEDPLVKQLLSGVAFLNAKVQQKINDGFPELTQAILETAYPHYLRPIPSMSIVQFDPAEDLDKKIVIDKDTLLKTVSEPNKECRFNTSYEVELLPIKLVSAKLMPRPFIAPGSAQVQGAAAVLKLSFQSLSDTLALHKLGMTKLRLFLKGHHQYVCMLYDLIFTKCVKVVLANDESDHAPLLLDPSCLKQVGFERDQGILPYPNNSFTGYRLLTEYFSFPEKFQFVDIDVGEKLTESYEENLHVYLYLSDSELELEHNISENNFALGCTPVVNLYRSVAEPISLTHKEYKYPVSIDHNRLSETEVYGFNSVQVIKKDGSFVTSLPFYGTSHRHTAESRKIYWLFHRSNVLEGEHSNEVASNVEISLVDINNQAAGQESEKIILDVLCTNRNLPVKLIAGAGKPFYAMVEGAKSTGKIKSIVPPTPVIRLPTDDKYLWRLVSHLNLNHLSLTEHEKSLETLKEILNLYDFKDSSATRSIIDSILSIRTKPVSAPIQTDGLVGLCRGIEMTLTLDPIMLNGTSSFIFASVLERFFGLYCSINSFTKLIVLLNGKDGELNRWLPRAGEKVLI